MAIDWVVSIAGALVGFVVGLTGMGGGALMTPVLVLLFGVQPLAAVSSDLVASMIMKPLGGGVHMKRGKIHGSLVLWLVVGSVPSAFAGVFLLKLLGSGPALEDAVRTALGVALFIAAGALCLKGIIQRKRGSAEAEEAPLQVRRLPTVLVGVTGGLVVGMTSVGSGSVMMLLLLALYPRLRLSELVGTDLVQAVPLVAAASLAHLLFGDFQLGLTVSILVGALPGVFVGALLSSKAPDRWIRPALVIVLLASSLKLLGVRTEAVLAVLTAFAGIVAVVRLLAARRTALTEQSAEPVAASPERSKLPSQSGETDVLPAR
ncbi:MAG TPA: sulfite exporter TauE/SafE family protein [Polyangiaceae bacterium]